MRQRRIIGMIGGGLTLALILFAGVSLSGRWNGDADGPTDATPTSAAASLTPVTFTRVLETRAEGRPVLQISGLAQPLAVVLLLDRGERIRQVRASAQGVWSAQIEITGPGMAIEAVLFEETEAQPQGPTNVPGTFESMTQIRGVETIFRLQRPDDPPPPTDEGEEGEPETPARLDTGPLIMITSPGAPTRLVRSPFPGLPTDGVLSVMTIDYDDSGGVIVNGRSRSQGRVRISVGEAAIGEARVAEDELWTYYDRSVMPVGSYAVTAELVGGAGGETASVTVPFERLPPLPVSNSDDGSLSVSFLPARWQIRRSLVGGGSQSTVIFAPAPRPTPPEATPPAEP